MASRRLGLRVLSLCLLGGGLVLIGLVAGYFIYSARARASVASVSQKAPEDEAWLETLPTPQPPPPLLDVFPLPEETPSAQEEPQKEPLPPVHFFVPGVGIDARVVEMGTVWKKDRLFWDIPDEAVGLFQGSPYPGEKGNVLMTGHKSSYFRGGIAVFKDLIKVELGDAIYIYSPNEWFLYRVVEKKVILPEEVELKPSDQPILTLITCEPEYVYNLRLVITAKLTKQGPLSKPLVH